jgi:hypothetical protein
MPQIKHHPMSLASGAHEWAGFVAGYGRVGVIWARNESLRLAFFCHKLMAIMRV